MRGCRPTSAMTVREKCAWSEKPRSWAMRVKSSSPSAIHSSASRTRTRLRYRPMVMPVLSLKVRVRWCGDTLAAAATACSVGAPLSEVASSRAMSTIRRVAAVVPRRWMGRGARMQLSNSSATRAAAASDTALDVGAAPALGEQPAVGEVGGRGRPKLAGHEARAGAPQRRQRLGAHGDHRAAVAELAEVLDGLGVAGVLHVALGGVDQRGASVDAPREAAHAHQHDRRVLAHRRVRPLPVAELALDRRHRNVAGDRQLALRTLRRALAGEVPGGRRPVSLL